MSDTLTLDPPLAAPRELSLDLGEPAPRVTRTSSSALPPARGRSQRKGLPPAAFGIGALVVAGLLWGAWVTKSIINPAVVKAPIASVRLQQIVGEYVQAQARSNTPPEVVAQQTQTFMTTLGDVLKARGADGTTVMVGEAVLSQNVPDITEDVRRAIYAKVPPPTAAAAPVMPALAAPSMPLGQ